MVLVQVNLLEVLENNIQLLLLQLELEVKVTTLLVVAVTLSCLLAAASERVFERPVRTAGRRLLARWMPPRGA